MDKVTQAGNFVWVELDNSSLPSMYVTNRDEWVYYGDNNDYPNYIINLANRHAEHNAILTGKCNYISGNGIKVDQSISAESEALIQKWINSANRFETWQDINKKITNDLEWFNGFYLQLVYGTNGKIVEYYHVRFSNIRISKCGNYAYYCENWVDESGSANVKVKNDTTFKKFNIYNSNIKTGTCIFQYKVSRPSSERFGDVYPIPDYVGAIRDIENDVNVTDHLYNKVRYGLTSNAIVNIYGTDPGEREKRKIAEGLKNNHGGKNAAGNFFLNFASENAKGVDITTLDMPEAYKQFETIEPRNEKKIFSGHKVTSKTLFGIATEGALSQRTEMLMAFELFKTTYINIRRKILEDVIKFFAKLADLEYTAIYVEGISPIDTELPLDSNAINEAMTVNEKRKYINEQYGLDLVEDLDQDTRLTLSKKLGTGGTQELIGIINMPLPISQRIGLLTSLFGINEKKAKKMLGVSDNIDEVKEESNKLSLAEKFGVGGTQGLLSVLSLPLTDEQKIGTLTVLFGLDENDALKLLGKKNSIEEVNPQLKIEEHKLKKQDEILVRLLECAEDDNDDEILEEEFIEHPEQIVTYDWEFNKHKKFYFVEGEVVTTRKAILDLLAGNPNIKLDVIAKQLGLDVDYIESEINKFIERGLILESVKGFDITPKGLKVAETLDPMTETEIYTVYKYALRDNAPKLKTESREFCQKLMAQSNSGKTWTREKVDSLSNEFGMSVWLYRGGFYHDPKSGNTTAYCRHIWKALTKIRRKK